MEMKAEIARIGDKWVVGDLYAIPESSGNTNLFIVIYDETNKSIRRLWINDNNADRLHKLTIELGGEVDVDCIHITNFHSSWVTGFRKVFDALTDNSIIEELRNA